MFSVYLITPFCGWLAAQLTKLLLHGRKRGVITTSHLYRSGGMPSAHTAIIVSLATIIGCKQGFSSAIFALAAIISLVVMYDSVNVRYIVGEQGKIITKLLMKEQGITGEINAPRIINGHTVPEVIVGALLGVVVAVVILLIENS
jgi:acid phosphatase family membrane protein YuiD